MGSPAKTSPSGLLEWDRVPGATYRLQFNARFTLSDAEKILGYLEKLGVTDVYASPVFTASPGSLHGYDTCSHQGVSEELGGLDGWERFSSALQERGMGLLLDIVPNHMGTHWSNEWWWDVLKHGSASRYARFFDIAWQGPDGEDDTRIVLPVLGGTLDEVIARGELKVQCHEGEFEVSYYEGRFPVSRRTPDSLLEQCLGAAEQRNGRGQDALRRILDAQNYELAFWRDGLARINYRRFFDVSSLVALRMEDEAVFEATHQTAFQWIQNGQVTGLRVDHPDGLRDPQEYFRRLQQAFATAGEKPARLYVVAEKILSPGEPLPRSWAVAGTTGYDFLNVLNGVFVAGENERAMTDIYRNFTGVLQDFPEVAYASKKHVLETSFNAEIEALAKAAHRISESMAEARFDQGQLRIGIIELAASFPTYRTYFTQERNASTVDSEALARATANALARSPVAGDAIRFIASLFAFGTEGPSEWRRASREFVLKFQQLTGPAAAKGVEDTAFYRYGRLISLNEVGGDPGQFGVAVSRFHDENRNRALLWPHSLLATSTHDTKRGEDARARINVLSEMPELWREAVLRWSRLNERHKTIAGGRSWPDRNDEYFLYQTLVGAWPTSLSQRMKAGQTLASATAPLAEFCDRISACMLKAIREAKRHTSWTEPEESYESAMQRFVDGLLDAANIAFLKDFADFHHTVSFYGAINSLSQTMLKLASPGVPDIYQGSEFENLSLVDPDNRRSVDFDHLGEQLDVLMKHPSDALSQFDGRRLLAPANAKLFVHWKTLPFRRSHRALFDCGAYVPLEARGVAARHVCAFSRTLGQEHVIVVVPRLAFELLAGATLAPCGQEVWGDTWLDVSFAEAKRWRNQFTDERVSVPRGRLTVADALAGFPVALIHST